MLAPMQCLLAEATPFWLKQRPSGRSERLLGDEDARARGQRIVDVRDRAEVAGPQLGPAVGIAVGSTTRSVARNAKKTAPAPTTKKKAKNPNAAGKLRVIFGIVLPCTDLLVLAALPATSKVAPQTRHLLAFSPSRVPQVGQIFVFEKFS